MLILELILRKVYEFEGPFKISVLIKVRTEVCGFKVHKKLIKFRLHRKSSGISVMLADPWVERTV